MHPSYFLILSTSEENKKRELALSADVSEWLFHRRFWDEFNQNYQTFFGQYEEEILPHKLTMTIVELLRALISELSERFETEIRFRYGWNVKKEELYCTVNRKVLVEEISKLKNLMEEASSLESDVYCQL